MIFGGLMNNIFSIDVEDYYHVVDEETDVPISQWDSLPNRVEANLYKIFDILDKHNSKSTCFFLGYIAKRYPHLVKEAVRRGHEIASHGMYHRLVYTLSQNDFITDISESKHLLEDISGTPVRGFRAPCFSVLEDNKHFFSDLAKVGYTFDSSVFPVKRDFGGIQTTQYAPYSIETENGIIHEFPITVAELFHKHICFFGGGYLRLFPYNIINHMSKKVNKENRPVIFYIHPREIDPEHPRIKMSRMRYFKSYVNLKTVESKLNKILSDHHCINYKEYMKNKGLSNE